MTSGDIRLLRLEQTIVQLSEAVRALRWQASQNQQYIASLQSQLPQGAAGPDTGGRTVLVWVQLTQAINAAGSGSAEVLWTNWTPAADVLDIIEVENLSPGDLDSGTEALAIGWFDQIESEWAWALVNVFCEPEEE